MRHIPAALALLLIMSCAGNLAAQDIFSRGTYGEARVIELPLGSPYTARHLVPYANHGFHYADGYTLLYLVNIPPGSYTLGLTCPPLNQRVSVFDRWPYDGRARRIELPMGPSVRTHPPRTEYRWNLGISPRSSSTALYVVVEVPRAPNGLTPFPHTVFLSSARPFGQSRKGVTCLRGPADLMLVSEREMVAYAVEKAAPTIDTSQLPALPIPGDLIQNGRFKDGLNAWTPHRDYRPVKASDAFALLTEGLRLSGGQGRAGIMQRINADVTGAAALILRADVRVNRQTQGGTGPDGREAPVAIAVCYTDAAGREHCRGSGFWRGFYALAPEEPNGNANGQKVPQGMWYRFIFDLMQLTPPPKTIHSVALEGAGWPEREGWVREIHLIRTAGKH